MTPFSAIVWTLRTTVGLQLCLLLSEIIRPGAVTDIVNSGGCLALVLVLATYLALRAYAPDRSISQAVGFRRTPWQLIGLAFTLGLFIQIPASHIAELINGWLPLSDAETQHREKLLSVASPLRALAVALVVGVAGPVVEELFYRGAIYGALRRAQSPLLATLATAGCFVLAHWNMSDMRSLAHVSPLLIVALALGLARTVSGSLYPPLVLHAGFNLTTVVSMVVGHESTLDSVDFGSQSIALGWLGSLALVYGLFYFGTGSAGAKAARAQDR